MKISLECWRLMNYLAAELGVSSARLLECLERSYIVSFVDKGVTLAEKSARD